MSWTGQALEHLRVYHSLQHEPMARVWAQRAADLMPHDLALGDMLYAQVDGTRVLLICRACGDGRVVPTLAQAADFRDRHYYCSVEGAVRTCHNCDRLSLGFETECRWCGQTELSPAETLGRTARSIPLMRETFVIDTGDGRTLAEITCGSLRQAQAAGRGLWPGEELTVAMI